MHRLNPAELEKHAERLARPKAVIFFLQDAVLQASEQDPLFSTEHWSEVSEVIVNLARHDIKAARTLLNKLYKKEHERREEENPGYLKQKLPRYQSRFSPYQSRLKELRKGLEKAVAISIAREEIRRASPDEIDARLTLMALTGKIPERPLRAVFVLSILERDPERACALVYEWQAYSEERRGPWRADAEVMDVLFPVCQNCCPDSLLKLISQNYAGRLKWLESWIVALLPALSTETVPRLLQLMELLKANARTSLVYKETDLALLSATSALPEVLRKECVNALADILELSLPIVPLLVEEGVRATDVVPSLMRLWEAEPTAEWADRLLQILNGFPREKRQQIASQLLSLLLSEPAAPGSSTRTFIMGLEKVTQR